MRKLLALATVASVAVLGLGMVPASATVEEKVGVCHRTASETNPYTFIEVPPAEANGHITGTSNQHNQQIVWATDGTWNGVAHKAGDLRLDYLAPNGESDCVDENAPPPPESPLALLSTPTCVNQTIVATGVNPGETEVTFDVFKNGVLVDSFIVGADNQGQSAAIPVADEDVITVLLQGGKDTLATQTVVLNCPPPPTGGGGAPAPCPGKITLSNWYGDPRVNITLQGDALFVVRGGVQRFTGLHVITKDLACNQTFRIGRYKVKQGHHLVITQDGVTVVNTVPPVRN